MNFNTIGGRKFFLTLGCGLVSTVLLWYGKLTSSDFVMLSGFTIGAYITGGTIENVKTNKEGNI
jgi:hypothetical protein